MKIGIDLSPLQGPHRLRGIGSSLIKIINNLPKSNHSKHEFVFYLYSKDMDDALKLLDLRGLNYSVTKLSRRSRITKKLPGKFNLIVSAVNQFFELKDLHFGDPRVKNHVGIDFFLQTDPSLPLPRSKHMTTGLVIYDLIPYVLEWDYLWTYKTARRRGYSRKASLRLHSRRFLYYYKLRVNCLKSNKIFSISQQTKKDLVGYMSVKARKIAVTPLGVTMPKSTKSKLVNTYSYQSAPWGYLPRPFQLDSKIKFILFVGGADSRRKLEDLISAFNNLRAEGHELKLVLAGDSMQGPNNVSTTTVRQALRNCSYVEDIVFLGFTDNKTRDWLYDNAIVFIYPSRYEGFGLPVLEAMSHGCPVISYDNAAVREVANDYPIYANNADDIRLSVLNILAASKTKLTKIGEKNIAHAKKFSWKRATNRLIKEIDNSI